MLEVNKSNCAVMDDSYNEFQEPLFKLDLYG